MPTDQAVKCMQGKRKQKKLTHSSGVVAGGAAKHKDCPAVL